VCLRKALIDQIVEHALHKIIGHRRATGHTDRGDASQPGGLDLSGVVDSIRCLGSGLERHFDQPHRVG
jgi:hypothetical protein